MTGHPWRDVPKQSPNQGKAARQVDDRAEREHDRPTQLLILPRVKHQTEAGDVSRSVKRPGA